MQVLGPMLTLQADADRLPLPWHCRIPLGFLSDTDVNIALVAETDRPAQSRRLPDLVITVLDPRRWIRCKRISASRDDEPGLVYNTIEKLKDQNIALAESVTALGVAPSSNGVELQSPDNVRVTRRHRVTLVTEDFTEATEVIDTLERDGWHIDSPSQFVPSGAILEVSRGTVDSGWLQLKRGFDWHKIIEERFPEEVRQYPLSRAVVSADMDARLMRFVFPRDGAKQVVVRHEDRPGMLCQIMLTLLSCKVNILSSLLRRGGESLGFATLICICEPSEPPAPSADPDGMRSALESKLSELKAGSNLGEGIISFGIHDATDGRQTVYPGPSTDTYFSDQAIKSFRRSVRRPSVRGLRPAKPRVFLSTRFGAEPKQLIDIAIRQFLTSANFDIIDVDWDERYMSAGLLGSAKETRFGALFSADIAILMIRACRPAKDPHTEREHMVWRCPQLLDAGLLDNMVIPSLLLVESQDVIKLAFPPNFGSSRSSIAEVGNPTGEPHAVIGAIKKWLVERNLLA